MPVGEQLYVLKEYWYKNPYPPYTGEVQDCALTLLMQGEASSAGTQPIAPVSIHCFIFLIVSTFLSCIGFRVGYLRHRTSP